MDNFENGFILSECLTDIKYREQPIYKEKRGKLIEVKNRKEQPPLIYMWIIFRYIGKNNDDERGHYIMPSKDIGSGLNFETIYYNLNLNNPFDFEYQPKEGDVIYFTFNMVLSPYISFMFKNKEWIEDHHNPFTEKCKEIHKGFINNI